MIYQNEGRTIERLEFLLANMTERAEEAERTSRGLQSEIDSHIVDARRRAKQGSIYEAYCTGWQDGRKCSLGVVTPTAIEGDWEVYQLDRARTQEVSDE